ncbi:MAG: Coenzyme F420 hydrogenase/dehydrogenase, beta subunit C-terminal domain [Erythrobacter sp.]|uniref:Coenzyme F420 hydrogenase/dehydrogenase, beta subunit C-terminal domain n=1 Tax=Erythrobacter sp. TaxID=1042 RepID=UPI003298CCD3
MQNNQSSFTVLQNTVLGNGLCVGCGACSAISGGKIEMRLNHLGQYEAVANDSDLSLPVASVCPFSSDSANEDEIAKQQFANEDSQSSEHIGPYLKCFAGHVLEDDFRTLGSSGGVAKWVLHELKTNDLVDHVVQVGAVENNSQGLVYEYRIDSTLDAIKEGSKSAYQPVEMSSFLEFMRENPGRYVVTAIPCFAKGLRLLAMQDPVLKERIRFVIGIICGHLKSTRYAESFAWQMGVAPGEMNAIDFRVKAMGEKANHKAIEVADGSGGKKRKLTKEFLGGDYNLGFFQYKACDYCDDVVGETTDISIGDAWLPEYVKDANGTSVVVVRNSTLLQMVEAGIDSMRLDLHEISEEKVVQSQAGGFRQRREGLAYRLYLAARRGEWIPAKRVAPAKNHIGRFRRRIYRSRTRLSRESHLHFSRARESGNFATFAQPMLELLHQHRKACTPPLLPRIWSRVSRIYKRDGNSQ